MFNLLPAITLERSYCLLYLALSHSETFETSICNNKCRCCREKCDHTALSKTAVQHADTWLFQARKFLRFDPSKNALINVYSPVPINAYGSRGEESLGDRVLQVVM